jgi:ABC-type branched-subunit amino acid transport system substrate-binding protein
MAKATTGMRGVAACGLVAGMIAAAVPALAQNTPGVSATEIKIGQTMPYSGPVTAYSALGKGEVAFFKMINDKGGINGRKINLISLDDGYIPAKTVEQTRKMVEQEGVAFLFSSIGTATNTSVEKYLNDRKIPQLFIGSGASKWNDPEHFPWTMPGVQATFRYEARIYTRYILKEKPDAKIAVLYQNDDYGKDYVLGIKDVLGADYAKRVIEATYEFTDPTVDSQVVSLRGSGADALIVAATPKFAAQTIRKTFDLGWKPMFFMSNVSIWVNSVLEPAGPEKAIGMLSSAYVKDPTDQSWANDAGMTQWRNWMKKYMPEQDINDQNFVNSYSEGMVMVQVLKQAGNDLSRANILRQATNLHDLELPVMLPGIKINTDPKNYTSVRDMQLMRWDGKRWVRFGGVVPGS